MPLCPLTGMKTELRGASVKSRPKTFAAILTNIAMPIISRGSLIWFGFVVALLLTDVLQFQ